MSKAKVVGAAFAAFLSLAGVKKAEATPTVEGFSATTTEAPSRYQQFAAEVEKVRPDIDILFVDYDTYEKLDVRAMLRGDANYYVLDRAKIAEDLGKMVPEGATFPEMGEGATREKFIDFFSAHFMDVAGESLSSAHAIGLQMQLPDGRQARICMASNVNQMTADEMVNDFLGGAAHAGEIKVEHIYDHIANHELAHCLTPEILQMSKPLGEALADVYAVARHAQQHGFDDGFIDGMRHMRRVMMVNHGDDVHYIAPLLDIAVPQIRAAHANGELQDMTPRDLMEQAVTWSFGRTPEERTRRAEAYHNEAMRQSIVLHEIHSAAEFQEQTGILTLKKPVSEFSTAALVTLSRYQQSLQAIQGHIQPLDVSAQQRYAQQLSDFLSTKPDAEDRLRAVMRRDAELQDRVQLLAEQYKDDPAALYQAMTAASADGVSLLQAQETIGNARQHIAGEMNAARVARMETEVSGVNIQLAQADLER